MGIKKVATDIGAGIGKVGSKAKDTIVDLLPDKNDNEPKSKLFDGIDDAKRQEMAKNFSNTVNSNLKRDVTALEDEAGFVGGIVISVVNKAASTQHSVVESYCDWLRSRHPDETPQQIQKRLDSLFTKFASAGGGAAGLAAAVPGVGLMMGAAAIGAESLVFIDATVVYTLASAYIRGGDISDPEQRKALVLVSLLGAKATPIVEAAVGDLGATASGKASFAGGAAMFKGVAANRLNDVNSRMTKVATKQLTKRLLPATIGKFVPLGIGAVIGFLASGKLASTVTKHTHESLGALPTSFPTPAPVNAEKPESIRKIEEVTKLKVEDLDNEI